MGTGNVRQGTYSNKTPFSLFIISSILVHTLVVLAAFCLPFLFKKESKKTPPIIAMQVVSLQVPQPKKPSTKKKIPQKTSSPQKSPSSSVQKKMAAPVPKKETTTPEEKSKETIPKKPSKSVKETLEFLPKTQVSTQNKVPPALKFWMGRVGALWNAHWNPPAGIGILGVAEGQIQATILRSGVIANMKLIQSSGNTFLDRQAKEALMRIGRFSPIPANYKEKNELTIHFVFKYYGNADN
jgi:TonB family protein